MAGVLARGNLPEMGKRLAEQNFAALNAEIKRRGLDIDFAPPPPPAKPTEAEVQQAADRIMAGIKERRSWEVDLESDDDDDTTQRKFGEHISSAYNDILWDEGEEGKAFNDRFRVDDETRERVQYALEDRLQPFLDDRELKRQGERTRKREAEEAETARRAEENRAFEERDQLARVEDDAEEAFFASVGELTPQEREHVKNLYGARRGAILDQYEVPDIQGALDAVRRSAEDRARQVPDPAPIAEGERLRQKDIELEEARERQYQERMEQEAKAVAEADATAEYQANERVAQLKSSARDLRLDPTPEHIEEAEQLLTTTTPGDLAKAYSYDEAVDAYQELHKQLVISRPPRGQSDPNRLCRLRAQRFGIAP